MDLIGAIRSSDSCAVRGDELSEVVEFPCFRAETHPMDSAQEAKAPSPASAQAQGLCPAGGGRRHARPAGPQRGRRGSVVPRALQGGGVIDDQAAAPCHRAASSQASREPGCTWSGALTRSPPQHYLPCGEKLTWLEPQDLETLAAALETKSWVLLRIAADRVPAVTSE